MILADKAQDVSNKEQLALVLRYVNKNGEINENLIKVIHCKEGVSGIEIADLLKKETRQLGLDLLHCRGQGYDGAGNTAGKCNSTSALIKHEFPKALFVHCASHCLNLCITATCDNLEIKSMMGNVKRAADFFNNSPKRQKALEVNIEQLAKGKPNKLINPCRTRWIECLKAVDRFVERYEPIMVTFEQISTDGSWNDQSRADAAGLFTACSNFQFIITLVIVDQVLAYTYSATSKLQSSHMDMLTAYDEIELILDTLENKVKCDIDAYHSKWYNEAVKLGEKFNALQSKLRNCAHQLLGDITPADTPKEYYRCVTVKFVDHLIAELTRRLNKENDTITKGFYLIPSVMIEHIGNHGAGS